jgi:NAD(P)-dependent dehydrogenase (short-subunit alcohol dehydrogenase family)
MSQKWTAEQIPDQDGVTAIVTGANSGLGLVTAKELSRHGAKVILACRSTDKGEAAAEEIAESTGAAKPEVRALDLSDLESVRQFSGEFDNRRLDLLVNNAGIMMTPQSKTADGFELQFGTNHLGHFALTGLLMGALQKGNSSRIVTLSSNEHKGGELDFDDLQHENGYSPRDAYQQSKLANAVFGLELDRRLRAAGSKTISVLAHPGYSGTNLQSTGPTGLLKEVLKVGNAVFSQSAERGALPTLYAATAPGVKGGEYYGPDGFKEMRGYPTRTKTIPEAQDPETGQRLWEVSEELTGVTYPLKAKAAPNQGKRRRSRRK